METEELMRAARERRAESLVVTPWVRRGWLLVAVVVGAAWGWFTVGDSPVYGGFYLVGAAYGVLLVSFEVGHARHRPGPVLATAPSGAPATAAMRSPVPQRLQGLVACYLLLVAVVVAVRTVEVGGRATPAWLATSVLLVVIAVAAAVAVGIDLLGRGRQEGLYLTAEGIEHADRDFRWSLGWDEVAGGLASAHLQVVLVGRRDVDRQRTSWWAWRPRSTTPGVVQVHGPALAVDPHDLASLIDDLVAHPAARSFLGTPASLDRLPVLQGR